MEWDGVPPRKDMGPDGDGVPPPCEQTDTCENITSRRTTYAVGRNYSLFLDAANIGKTGIPNLCEASWRQF